MLAAITPVVKDSKEKRNVVKESESKDFLSEETDLLGKIIFLSNYICLK